MHLCSHIPLLLFLIIFYVFFHHSSSTSSTSSSILHLPHLLPLLPSFILDIFHLFFHPLSSIFSTSASIIHLPHLLPLLHVHINNFSKKSFSPMVCFLSVPLQDQRQLTLSWKKYTESPQTSTGLRFYNEVTRSKEEYQYMPEILKWQCLLLGET